MKNTIGVLTAFALVISIFSVVNANTSTNSPDVIAPQENVFPATPASAPQAELVPNSVRAGETITSRDLTDVIQAFSKQIPISSGSKQAYSVLALIADNDHPIFRSSLVSYPEIAAVDFFDARAAVPTLAQLSPYDVVITWSNYAYADMVATGDTLAEYVDLGGAVICAGWCWYLNGNHLDGEIMDSAYNPFTGLGGCHFDSAGLGSYDPDHPIMTGVSAVSDSYRDSVAVNPGAEVVAYWSDSEYFIATKGPVVGINGIPGDYGVYTGDMILIYYNAVVWTQTITEFAIFQDRNPWGYTSNQDILRDHSYGFDVYNSSDIGVVDLTPYRKVIIASQQPNSFYVTVSANRTWFQDYITNGGVLEFHGASWSLDDWAGLTMPTGFTCEPFTSTNSVSIQHPGHPLVLIPGIITDAELDGWGASAHSYLLDLLPGYDEVLRHDDANEPCLIVQPYGDGWLIATMNTLEWGYQEAYSTILENVLLWMPGATYAIFQDFDPWGFSCNQDILSANGIGYDMYTSSYLGLTDLSMYTKVVTSSAQQYSFYDSLSTHRTRFESYVNNGGVLEFHGATYFVYDWAGMAMPTGFTCAPQSSNSSDYVSIQAVGHPIVTTPNIIGDVELDDWHYSTHGHLVSLIPGYTEVLQNDSTVAPCLAVLEYGSGWVIATMNALEWGYDNGYSPILENVLLYMPLTGVEEVPSVFDLQMIALHQNYPNPFESKTSISYHIPAPVHVSLKVYDKAGRLVKTLVDGTEQPGTMMITWNGKDEAGTKVANGVYFYSLETGDTTLSKKLVLLR